MVQHFLMHHLKYQHDVQFLLWHKLHLTPHQQLNLEKHDMNRLNLS